MDEEVKQSKKSISKLIWMPLKPVVSVQHSTSTEFKGIQIGPSNESHDLSGSVEGSSLTQNYDSGCVLAW